MSNFRLNESLDSNLRTRILGKQTDVPVFENHFRRAAATAALRADPGSGQTPGFAHRAELQPEPKVLPGNLHPILCEDPTLIRLESNSEKLRDHLLGKLSEVTVFEIRAPERIEHASEFEDKGIALAPESWRPAVWIEPSLWEKISVRLSAANSKFRLSLKRANEVVRVLVGKLTKSNLPSHIVNIFVLFCRKLFHIAVFTTASLYSLLLIFGDLQSIVARKLVSGIIAFLVGLKELAHGSAQVLRKLKGTRPKLHIKLPKLELRFPKPSTILGFASQGMMVGALVLFLMTVGPIIRLQAGEWWTKSRTAITGKAIEPQVKEVLTDTVRKADEVPPEEKQFQLLIPKLDANMKVVANVDAGSEKEYSVALKKGVAHAAGSGLPGEVNTTNKSIYIFGHSTNTIWNIERYNALFYSLKDLAPQDEIIVWFWGKEFKYSVKEVVKVDPKDLTYLTPQTDKDQLILQTCWPPGTTWKRLLVVAEPSAQ